MAMIILKKDGDGVNVFQGQTMIPGPCIGGVGAVCRYAIPGNAELQLGMTMERDRQGGGITAYELLPWTLDIPCLILIIRIQQGLYPGCGDRGKCVV